MAPGERRAPSDHRPWNLRALIEASGIDAALRADAEVRGVSHDSRTVGSGDLFCCIPGAVHDGHAFARQAADAGASALLVERDVAVDLPQARVARVRAAVGPLSNVFFGRPSEAMDVVGVTGTNGKTTVTYLVEAIAAAAGRSAGVIGNIERRLGRRRWPSRLNTPESIDLHRVLAEMAAAGGDVVAVEATSEGIDQGRIDGVRFACAAFTNLTQDHLNYHGTMDAYFDAKARLFEPARTRSAAVNVRDAWGRRLVERCAGLDVLTFAGEDADVRARRAELGRGGTVVVVATPQGDLEVTTRLVGPYNVENVLCATAVALALGIDGDAIAAGIGSSPGVPGRLEVVVSEPFTVVVDYAHTPDALANVVSACRTLTDRRVIVVVGCGGDRDRAKRPLMGEVATSGADLTIITSDNPRSEDPEAIVAEIVPGAVRGGGEHRVVVDRRAAIAEALTAARPGDVVLVAGKGHETGQTFADRTIPFDDREVVRELTETRCRN